MSAPAPLPPTEDLKHPIAPGVGVAQSVRSTSTATEDAGHGDVEKQAQALDEETATDLARIKSKAPSEFEYPSTAKAMVIMSGLYLAIFLVALDRTIIGTAIPAITNEFNSFSDIGWYQSAYMLTTAGLQLLFGRIYTFYSPKWTYIIAITIFEIGSAISGAAPSSAVLIVGRAISGIGGAGMFGGSMVIIFNVLPLEKRPLFMGLIGGVFGIASVVGPLLGGVFTNYVSWRWCFYINLPVGAITIVLLLFVLRQDFTMAAAGKSTREKILQLDPLGTLCFIPALVCLLLALQWGGSTYAWSDGRIVACLVLFAVLLVSFCVLQCVRPENRCTVPVRIIKNRSIVGGFWFTIFGGGTMVILALYIPIWFQAIKGIDAVQSGIRTIPLILAMVIFIVMSGALIQRIGYYTPFMIAGACIMPVGCGLISTWSPNSAANHWIGYQVLAGIGMGMALQQPNIAAQTVLPRKDASMGVGLMILGQTMGGAIFASVSQNIIDTQLVKNLTAHPIAGINPTSIVNAGATNLRKLVPAAELPAFLDLYNNAITRGLLVAVGCSAATIIGALMMEWVSTKKDMKPKAQPAAVIEEKPEEVSEAQETREV